MFVRVALLISTHSSVAVITSNGVSRKRRHALAELMTSGAEGIRPTLNPSEPYMVITVYTP